MTQAIEVSYPEPHMDRMKRILSDHPEVKKLFGHSPSTAFFVCGTIALQIATAWLLRDAPLWAIFLASYTVGAAADHALWVLIHECTHNLVFKTTRSNSWLAIACNLPIIFPSAMSFRTYHIKHHLHQGDYDRDADLPRPFEANLVGNSTWKKSLWLFFFFASQLVRVPFLKGIEVVNRWVILNWVVQLSFLTALSSILGWKALIYIAASSVFSIGLHPLGGRWIQEHYVVKPNQETYSYYGGLNRIAFNVGFHNEHHDFMSVPWSRLPEVRKIAPEAYDTLYWHKSWSLLVWRFLTDPQLSLYSRVTRRRAAASALRRSTASPANPAETVETVETNATVHAPVA